MPLTDEQKKIAQAPHGFPNSDLTAVMEVLVDESLWDDFGTQRDNVIARLYRAAVMRKASIPFEFGRKALEPLNRSGLYDDGALSQP